MKLLFDYLVQREDDTEYDINNIAWYNIVMLSVSMLLIFSSQRTLVNAMKILIWEIHTKDPAYNVSSDVVIGYSILLLSFTYFVAPWIIYHSEPRIWMLIFGLCTIAHIAQFLYPIKEALYVTSALVGISASLSGTAHAYYINQNSFYNTIAKNSEVFWAIIQGNMLVGNFFVYMLFKDDTELNIPLKKDHIFYYLLIIMASIGFGFIMFLGQPVGRSDELYDLPWLLVLKVIQVFFTRDILLLTITFAYNGFQDTFMSGVYSNTIGFTKCLQTHNRLRHVSLSGLIIGVGSLSGVIVFGFFKNYVSFKWHFKLYVLGIFLHSVSYILILLNIPNDAVLYPSDKTGLVMCNFNVAIFCSFLQGCGSYCIHTKIYALIIEKYGTQYTTAIFLEIFMTKLFASIAYFYTSTQLHIVIGMLLLMEVLGTIAFCIVECFVKNAQNDELDRPRPKDTRFSIKP